MHDPLDLDHFDFAYPEELIAHEPAEPRDACRLLHVPALGPVEHLVFRDFPRLLQLGDLLVLNETKVLKARLRGSRVPSGGAVEVLVLGPAPENPELTRVLAKPARRMKPGSIVQFGDVQTIVESPGLLRFPAGISLRTVLDKYGELPLPPYISPRADLERDDAYQTVFARIDGSVAAPTASLHFTEELLQIVVDQGVGIAKLSLDIGLGTFAPVRGTSFSTHTMHEELYDIPELTTQEILRTKERGNRVIAVGTTVVRALESAAQHGILASGPGSTNIFLTPGYQFRIVDALLTNFHVPRSTLLALVSAFSGRENILAAYASAIEARYRLFSFGDAMFLERT